MIQTTRMDDLWFMDEVDKKRVGWDDSGRGVKVDLMTLS